MPNSAVNTDAFSARCAHYKCAGYGKRSRHEVAFLYVIPHRCIVHDHPACPRRYPREACYRCADDGVQSPPDNVPNWEETVRWTPLRESRPVKG